MSVPSEGESWSLNDSWINSTRVVKHEPGDFTPFYITITICSLIGGFLIILNVFFCWCSHHRQYWQDRHTGNRWIQSMWVTTPHKAPPLDLTELESRIVVTTQYPDPNLYYPTSEVGDVEAHFPGSELGGHHSQEYLALHKRESDI